MDDLLKPPTAVEIAELMDAVTKEAHGVGLKVLRRLAFHADRQSTELVTLKTQLADLTKIHQEVAHIVERQGMTLGEMSGQHQALLQRLMPEDHTGRAANCYFCVADAGCAHEPDCEGVTLRAHLTNAGKFFCKKHGEMTGRIGAFVRYCQECHKAPCVIEPKEENDGHD